MSMPDYYCKQCYAPAEVIDGTVVRSCSCTCAVIAVCEAVVSADGKVSNECPASS